ncbi:MAG: hypothetical protein DCF20_16905 [Pseudanabaena sp.]|nr:MAG: hypothetical protein DCF20_16905 [Pseudanabaena sp.]
MKSVTLFTSHNFLGLNRVVRRLVTEYGLKDSKIAFQAISEYECFFSAISSDPQKSYKPSYLADLVWQLHMLDTKAYTKDCFQRAGQYIHRCNGVYFPQSAELSGIARELLGNYAEPIHSHTPFIQKEFNSISILDQEDFSALLQRVRHSLEHKAVVLAWVTESLYLINSEPETAIREYKRFIELMLLGERSLTPCKLVDEIWHQHILDSKSYFLFCYRVAGRYLHHAPHYEKPHRFHKSRFQKTQVIYKKYFDSKPNKIWIQMGCCCGSEPDPLFIIDSPVCMKARLKINNINRQHYELIHPVLKSKGVSEDLWKSFLNAFNSVPYAVNSVHLTIPFWNSSFLRTMIMLFLFVFCGFAFSIPGYGILVIMVALILFIEEVIKPDSREIQEIIHLYSLRFNELDVAITFEKPDSIVVCAEI